MTHNGWLCFCRADIVCIGCTAGVFWCSRSECFVTIRFVLGNHEPVDDFRENYIFNSVCVVQYEQALFRFSSADLIALPIGGCQLKCCCGIRFGWESGTNGRAVIIWSRGRQWVYLRYVQLLSDVSVGMLRLKRATKVSKDVNPCFKIKDKESEVSQVLQQLIVRYENRFIYDLHRDIAFALLSIFQVTLTCRMCLVYLVRSSHA